MDKFERIEFIKKFLHDNQDLSSYQASEKLEAHGVFASASVISKCRAKYNIKFVRATPVADKIKVDFKAGIRFKNSYEIARYYKCSQSHAKKVLHELKGLKVDKIKKKPQPIAVVTLEPVRVNTMQHAVMQLMQKCA